MFLYIFCCFPLLVAFVGNDPNANTLNFSDRNNKIVVWELIGDREETRERENDIEYTQQEHG